MEIPFHSIARTRAPDRRAPALIADVKNSLSCRRPEDVRGPVSSSSLEFDELRQPAVIPSAQGARHWQPRPGQSIAQRTTEKTGGHG